MSTWLRCAWCGTESTTPLCCGCERIIAKRIRPPVGEELEWARIQARELSMAGQKINVGKSVRIKDGKVLRTHRVAAGQRKNAEGKAKREVEAWAKKSKPKDVK